MKKSRSTPTSSRLFWLVLLTFVAIFTVSLLLSSFRSTPPTINQIDNDSGMVTLALNPSTVTIEPGASTTIALQVGVAKDQKLAAIQVDLELSSLCGNPEVTQGDFLPTELSAAKLNGGHLRFAYGASLNSGGVEGTGTVATIKLTPPDVGSCQLSFNPSTKAAIVGSNDNSVKTASDSTITVAEPSSASSDPSASPSQAPSQAASSSPSNNNNQPASKTTTLRLTSTTCNSLSFSWDKLNGAKGYLIELADNSNFTNSRSSGTLGSDRDTYTFNSLASGTKFFVRLTQTDIHDFPRWTNLTNLTTLAICPGSELKPSPTSPARSTATPTPRVSPRPTTSPAGGLSPQGSVPSLAPVAYTDERFKDIPVDSGVSEPEKPSSLFARFIAWLVSLFSRD